MFLVILIGGILHSFTSFQIKFGMDVTYSHITQKNHLPYHPSPIISHLHFTHSTHTPLTHLKHNKI